MILIANYNSEHKCKNDLKVEIKYSFCLVKKPLLVVIQHQPQTND